MGKTKEELEQASKHVKYELDMMAAMTSFLSKGPKGTDQATWNAYLESFVLHVRNLIEFYSRSEDTNHYIVAEHYVSDVNKWKGRPDFTPLLEDANRRVNNFATHLTYNRLTWRKDWEFAAIAADLEKVRICFLDHLPPDRKDWFELAETQGPEGPTGTTNPSVVKGWTGPPGPTGSTETTSQK
jgi:hypothetical protein